MAIDELGGARRGRLAVVVRHPRGAGEPAAVDIECLAGDE
jgi:hypothetical protein